MMAEPPRSVAADDMPPREYIFVLDVSGSMNGFPLDTAKKLMRDLVRVVRPTDTFNVVLFADGSRTLAPASLPASRRISSAPFASSDRNRAAAERSFSPRSNERSRLPRTAPNVARTVVLLTDGYIDAEKETFGYIRDHLDQANFFSFGIGSSINRFLIEGVARAGQGEPFVVTRPEESAKAAAKFRRYIQSPVLDRRARRVQWVRNVRRRAGEGARSFRRATHCRLRQMARQTARNHRRLGNERQGRVSALRCPSQKRVPDDGHRALSYLWARARLSNLFDFEPGEDEGQRGGDHGHRPFVQSSHAVHVVRRGPRRSCAMPTGTPTTSISRFRFLSG